MYNQQLIYKLCVNFILQEDKIIESKIHHSNSNGDFIIISPVFKYNNRKCVKIKFIKTGTEKIARLDAVTNGAVSDELYDIDFEKIYYSNLYGPFKIIEFAGRDKNGRKLVKIRFLKTRNEKIITYKAAKLGYAVDDLAVFKCPLDASILPVNEHNELIYRTSKNVWKEMINRCTNPNCKSYNTYGKLGVSVDESWMDFNTFFNDIKTLPQYEKYYNRPFEYQLDKDYLQQNIDKNSRIYSKNSCMFLSKYDNNNLAIIEYRNSHINELSSIYFGVNRSKNRYRAAIVINSKNISIGTFSSEIAAANAFNCWFEKFHNYELVLLHNDVPYMPPEEFVKYNVAVKEVIRLIKDIKNA